MGKALLGYISTISNRKSLTLILLGFLYFWGFFWLENLPLVTVVNLFLFFFYLYTSQITYIFQQDASTTYIYHSWWQQRGKKIKLINTVDSRYLQHSINVTYTNPHWRHSMTGQTPSPVPARAKTLKIHVS